MIPSPNTAFSSPETRVHDPRPIINLREFVHSVTKHNPKVFNSDLINISPKWRCRLIPEFDEQERLIVKDEYDTSSSISASSQNNNNNNNNSNNHNKNESQKLKMLHFFANGVPALAAQARSQPVHDVCKDAIDFINDPHWRQFPAPKIAFRGGWAGPGTKMEDAKLHQMVRGFDEVLDASKCATDEELASKYSVLKKDAKEVEAERDDGDEEAKETERKEEGHNNDINRDRGTLQQHTSDEILNLQLFHRADAALHPQLPILSQNLLWPESIADPSVVCDNATRVSKAGAITWWHLDDCGEFVMQTGLDRKDPEKHLEGVKLFIYGPTASYDWFMHDAQSEINAGGKIAALDILKAPCDALPPAEFLPVLNVAVLQAGGRPLISPPNIPHIVVTLRDCVMVEQRRVMLQFLHEVLYFAQRMQLWKGSPVLYPILGKDLQEQESVMEIAVQIAKKLEKCLEASGGAGGDENLNHNDETQIKKLNSALCVRSLLALTNHQLFKGSNCEALNDRVRQILSSFADKIPFEISQLVATETEFLEAYCDVDRTCWMHLDSDATSIFRMMLPTVSNDGTHCERKFSCVLYYGGDLCVKQDDQTQRQESHSTPNDKNDAKQEAEEVTGDHEGVKIVKSRNNRADNGDDNNDESRDDSNKGADNHPIAKKLRNGFLPCWCGGVFDTIAQARDAGRRAVTNLKSAVPHDKGHAITLQDIVEAFKERDEMLEEFF